MSRRAPLFFGHCAGYTSAVMLLLHASFLLSLTASSDVTVNGTRYVSLLGEIHLTCNATGADTAPDAVDWFFNGDVVNESRRTAIVQHKPYPGRTLISELIIEKASMLDGGNYVCRSIEVGNSSEVDTFNVHVLNDMKNRKAPKRGDGMRSSSLSSHGVSLCYIMCLLLSSIATHTLGSLK